MFVKQIKNFAAEVIAAVAVRLLPSGGNSGQVLAKTSATDYAVGWATYFTGLNADMTRSSSTSIAIGTGSKTFTYASSSNLGWAVGTRLRAANNASNYMEGIVTAVSSTSVTITSDLTKGSGTLASWTITIAGAAGATGATGANGANGLNADMTRSSTTSIAIGTGSKTFTYASSSNLGWAVGTRLRAANNASNWMEGIVTAVSSTSVTITSDLTKGSGTLASWTITIAGETGNMDCIMGLDTASVTNTTTETTLKSFVVSSWNLSRQIKLKFYCEWTPDTTSSNRTAALRVFIGPYVVAQMVLSNQSIMGGVPQTQFLADITIIPVSTTEGYALVGVSLFSNGDYLGIIPMNIGVDGDGHGACTYASLATAQTVYITAQLNVASPDNSLSLRAYVFEN